MRITWKPILPAILQKLIVGKDQWIICNLELRSISQDTHDWQLTSHTWKLKVTSTSKAVINQMLPPGIQSYNLQEFLIFSK